MIRIPLNGIKKWYYLTIILLLLQACGSYKFVPDGAILNDNSIYFNDKLKAAIWLPGDFILYNEKNNRGLSVTNLTERDKVILKFLKINPSGSKILFSGTPVVPPFYNLICVEQRMRSDEPITQFIKKIKNDKTDIGIGSIRFRNKLITLIYYNDNDNECPYCDIDSIYFSNKRRITEQLKSGIPYNRNSLCQPAETGKMYNYHFPPTVISTTDTLILEINNIIPADSSENLYSYQLIKKPAATGININLCPGHYVFKLKTYQNKTITKSEVNLTSAQ